MSSSINWLDCPKCGGDASIEQDNKTCEITHSCSNCDWRGEDVVKDDLDFEDTLVEEKINFNNGKRFSPDYDKENELLREKIREEKLAEKKITDKKTKIVIRIILLVLAALGIVSSVVMIEKGNSFGIFGLILCSIGTMFGGAKLYDEAMEK